MRKLFFVFFSVAFLVACSSENAPTCDSVSGTELCLDGQSYTNFSTVFWEKENGHIEIQLEPNVTGPGEYAAIYFFLYGTTIDVDTVPHVGTYTSIPFATPSTGSMDFSGWLQTISGGNVISYTYEQDAANTLEITEFSSNEVSGNGNFNVRNTTTNVVSTAVFSFENIPFQP